jgi:hypothetical protein
VASTLVGGCKAKLWPRGIENTIVSVEEDVTVDVLVAGTDALKTAEASCAAGVSGPKVQVLSWDGSIVRGSNQEAEGWQAGSAREGITALSVVQLGARNTGVVLANLRISHEDQGGASVCGKPSDIHSICDMRD